MKAVHGGGRPSKYIIKSDSVRWIYYKYYRDSPPIGFSRMFDLNSDNDSVQLVSSNGVTVLKTWRESEKDEPGRQFFNEKFWINERDLYGGQLDSIWTFVVLPEDLQ